MLRGVLCDVGCCTTVFAAEREALQQPQRNQNDRRCPTDRFECWEQTDGERGGAHADDGDQERVLAPDEIAYAAEYERAERSDQKARGVRCEAGQQRRRLVALGKEESRKERRKRCVKIEVVPLEYCAQRACENDSLLFGLEIPCSVRQSSR